MKPTDIPVQWCSMGDMRQVGRPFQSQAQNLHCPF